MKELVSEFERKLESETGMRTRLDEGNDEHKAKGQEERRQLEEDIGREGGRAEHARHASHALDTVEAELTLVRRALT